MRSFMIFLMMSVEYVYSHERGGMGLSHATRLKWLVTRCSHALPVSLFVYSTLPPSISISYGLIAASPTKITR